MVLEALTNEKSIQCFQMEKLRFEKIKREAYYLPESNNQLRWEIELSEEKPEISEDLKKIVSTTIESIREGLKGKGCGVIGQIEFEIAVIKTKEAKGGLKFLIADASGNYSKESVSRIKFNITGCDTPMSRKLGATWLDK